MRPRLIPSVLAGLTIVLLAFGSGEALVQHREDEYVDSVARAVLAGASARDFDSKVLALRDHVRGRVRNINFSRRDRPFLRHTAAQTLRSGKGRCGEAARVFVNLARAAGIPAQRLYFEGRQAHVVVVVRAEDGRYLVVDPTNRFYLPNVEALDGLKLPAAFRTYSAFGWRRLRALRALPSNFVSLGPLSYLIENPHALLACLYFLSSGATLALAFFLQRRPARRPALVTEKGFALPAAQEGQGVQRPCHIPVV